jgi:hypothetical protein
VGGDSSLLALPAGRTLRMDRLGCEGDVAKLADDDELEEETEVDTDDSGGANVAAAGRGAGATDAA